MANKANEKANPEKPKPNTETEGENLETSGDPEPSTSDCANKKNDECPSKCKGSSKNKSGIGIFKATVETWRPGPQKITCPECNETDVPCIRMQKNKVAYTSVGATCMLSCWPLCVMPFLMPKGSCVELFCKHCGSYLGQYNRKTGALTTCCTDNDKKMKKDSSNIS